MYKVTFASLSAPETKQAGVAMVRRAGVCLADKLIRTAPGAHPIIDYDAAGGKVTVRSESLEALLPLPRSIGSPVGHFGQLERSAEPQYEIDRLFRVAYTLKPFARNYGVNCRQRLTRQVAVRLFDHLTAQMSAFDVCLHEGTNTIFVHFDNGNQSGFLPESFNAVFSRTAIVATR